MYADDEDAVPLPVALEMLRKLAREEYSVHKIDLPKATYSVQFAPLQNTAEYEDFAVLEKIAMGDTVRVIHEEDRFEISARMLSYRFNPFTEEYISITLGNFTPRFTDISKAISRIDDGVSQANENANFALQSANGKNTNFYGSDEPETPISGDLWFKENGEKIEIWIFEERDGVLQWFPLSTDLTQEAIRLELEEAKSQVELAVQKAAEAVIAGQEAQQAAADAQKAGEDAHQAADDALMAGNNALTTANQAKSDAENAVIAANEAFDNADLALARIGAPPLVRQWERGTISSQGDDTVSTSILRSVGFIPAKAGNSYIAQYPDGAEPLSATYHYYQMPTYTDFVPVARQWWVWHVTGTYTNTSIVNYLNTLAVETMAFNDTINLNTYTGQGDMLLIHRLPLGGRPVPKVIQWFGRKDTSDNAIFLFSNNTWTLIGMVTEGSANKLHEWVLTESQRSGITSGNVHICFFAIKQGAWAGIYNNTATPHTLNPQTAGDNLLQHLSSVTSSNAVIAPNNVSALRVRITTSVAPDIFDGNVYLATERRDYTSEPTVYSAILQQSELINLRVVKGEIINQINISTESILIAGNRIHITGNTTIDNAVISTAMIADLAVSTAKIAALAVTEAKIGNLAVTSAKIANAAITAAKIGSAVIGDAHIINVSADKLYAGFISADRIAAGSITSAKLTVANGFITNAMIADATIQNAKIATLDAAKITTGTLSAARIAAGSITGDKFATNALQVGFGGWTDSIRINPTNINYFSGSDLVGNITADGLGFYRGTSFFIGRFATSYSADNPNIRGISMNLNGQGHFLGWMARSGNTGNFTTFLLLDPYAQARSQAGLHLACDLCTNGYYVRTGGNRVLRPTDLTLNVSGAATGPFPAWGGENGRARIVFGTDHVYIVSNNVFSTQTAVTTRISELISRVNGLITRLNNTGYQSGVNSTNLTTMGTSLTVP
jgi:hypothetical protein